MQQNIFPLFILLALLYGATLEASENPVFVGSANCEGCHAEVAQEWRQSDHFHAMAEATKESVNGDFSDVTLQFHGNRYRLFQQEDGFKIAIKEGKASWQTFKIDYTFGHYPLQQYLVELEDGHIQALNVAWDDRPMADGGQKWFHLRADEKIDDQHPFYWKNHYQNWNSRCASCHSTNLKKNYNAQSHSYATTWSEANVACESCHGPGSVHIERARSNNYLTAESGLILGEARTVQWSFREGKAIAVPNHGGDSRHVDMCGSCHSLRSEFDDFAHGLSYDDQYRLRLIDEQSYFLDGQIREEVYVLGSFMQSKMFEKGVTCTNCHNPHSGKTIANDNGLCTQCHKASEYDVQAHHQHALGSEAAQCVTCHMPERTFMQVDARRDHGFHIPNASHSASLQSPLVCLDCHQDKNREWARKALHEEVKASGAPHWGELLQGLMHGNLAFETDAIHRIANLNTSRMVRASLLAQMANLPSERMVNTVKQNLKNDDPVVRRSTVEACSGLPADLRWQILAPYLKDSSKSVRLAIAEVLSEVYESLAEEEKKHIDALLGEYRRSLFYNADSPAALVSIGNLEVNLRNFDEAEKAYRRAIEIEPSFVPAYLNLADYHRLMGREQEVKSNLLRAQAIVPNNPSVNHSLGLYFVRQKNYKEALNYLNIANTQTDSLPSHAYVLAVAQQNTGSLQEAINTLEGANVRWPYRLDLLQTLIVYLAQNGDQQRVFALLPKLEKITPNSPLVQRLRQAKAQQ